jgi:SAM-dependent methyltransferase
MSDPRPGTACAAVCPLCGHAKQRVLPFRYAFRGRHLHGVRCLRCALVFVHPQPTPAEIGELYGVDYFTRCTESCGAHGRAAYMETASQAQRERTTAARELDELARRHAGGRGAMLEIGCGPGFMLAEMRALGWDAHGLEISEYAVRHARETLGLDVAQGIVAPGRLADGAFDLVLMGDVLEHLADPLAALRIVRGWLKPAGIAVIAVPSTLNLLSARIGMLLYARSGACKTLQLPPYHLFEFTPATLTRMVEAAGLRLVRLDQSAVPLAKMGLRGTPLENAGKQALQLVAHASTRLMNRGGDRLRAVVRR